MTVPANPFEVRASNHVLCPGGCGQEFLRTDWNLDPPPYGSWEQIRRMTPTWQIDGDWMGAQCPTCDVELEDAFQATCSCGHQRSCTMCVLNEMYAVKVSPLRSSRLPRGRVAPAHPRRPLS